MSAAKDFLEELELFGKSWNYIYSTKATLRDFARSCKGVNATEFDVPVDVTEDDVKKWLKDDEQRLKREIAGKGCFKTSPILRIPDGITQI